MDSHIDTKEQLGLTNSQSSLLEVNQNIGVCDLDSEDGKKYDSNTDEFLSAEEESDYKMPSLKTIKSEYAYQKRSLLNLQRSEMRSQTPEGALERVATLAEGIRTLGKSQEENWKKMHDLIMKKDSLIKQMADIMISCKTKISPSDESLNKDYCNQSLSSSGDNNMQLIPEKDTSGCWDPEETLSALEDVSVDDISEVSTDDIHEMPIIGVPDGYGDQEAGTYNANVKELDNVHPTVSPESGDAM